MSFPKKSSFISALLHRYSPPLCVPETASWVLCASRAWCALGLGTLGQPPLKPPCSVVHLEHRLPFLPWLCCLCHCFCEQARVSAVCAQQLTRKERIVAKAKTAKTKGTASLPGTCSCRALPAVALGGESHPAMLHSSLLPGAWVGVLCNPDTMQAFPHFWGASIQQVGPAGLGK